ncbi:C-terminal processing peptidase-1. Serine peptidase. MEROPS family S41A [Kushneria avicenniae]|uniref:C-terminal processing peptidase-1. Serine peptidase. MEROPS family S41A n=1 Tax=Kushneria avicenniae TaxID=402385 RepID=A0A1I1MIB1_9GAMM|nr:carboxy terminal-processing peptidase [Kushneria avicenniae]SFC82413.1 C-terminal processing peptidase-1. Serine peptidase. MEROPS family S41A [Kushneria avicenniae]
MSLFAPARNIAVFALCLLTALPAMGNEAIKPTDEGRQASREVIQSLEYGHYEPVTLNNDWSEKVFNRMLKLLDSQHAYLTRDDIAQFGDLRTNLDEMLVEGDLDRVYAFYNLYQTRLENRLEWLINRLEKQPDFDFTGNERLPTNLEDANWAESQSELDDLWRRRLKNAALTLSLAPETSDDTPVVDTSVLSEIATVPARAPDPETPADDNGKPMSSEKIAKQLADRYKSQLSRVKQTNTEDVLSVILNAATGSIDPHSEYLSPSRGESFDIQMKLSLEGIGALLQQDSEYVRVSSLVSGGPAERSGQLKPADRIVAVGDGDSGDMISVIGMRLDEVVEHIRGPKGSKVRLEIIPAKAIDVTQTRTIEITRDTVSLEDQAASSRVIETNRNGEKHRVGVIKVPAFYVDFDAYQAGDKNYRSSTRDVAQLIDKLKAQNVEGIVLDMRGNGGGALQEANSMVGLFIDRGPTVQVRDARGRISLYGDTDRGVAYDGPLAVLVDRLSASASEIFAGAIQDYGRGLILGNQTFGKGTVQTLSDLSHGELKLTRAKFYRISGESTQLRGVEPDIAFPSLIDKDEIGESALDFAMPWDTVRPVSYRQYGEPWQYVNQLDQKHDQRARNNPNFRYLVREAQLAEQFQAQNNTVSLNREQRKREMEAQEAEQLALENQRRRALGMPEIDTWTDARDEALQTGDSDTESESPIQQAATDESVEILLDYALLPGNIQGTSQSAPRP